MQQAQTITMPERRCILTGKTRETDDLIRFVLSPEGGIVPDIAAKLPGRGFWVLANRALIDDGVKKGALAKGAARALKQPVAASAVPLDVADRIDRLLRTRCLNLLGLERKKGTLVLGFDGTAEAIRGGKAVLIVQADNAARDGREKLQALLDRMQKPLPVFTVFGRDELGLALGRSYVVHAAVKASGSAARLQQELMRLAAYGSLANGPDGLDIEG